VPGNQSGSFGSAFNSWSRRDVRISDADREQVVEALRKHAGDGRLTVDELTQRMEQAYAAKTFGELEVVQRDLPRAYQARYMPVASGPTVIRRTRRHRTVVWLALRLAFINLVLVGIWAAIGANTHNFWPVWTIGLSVIWLAFRGLRVLERNSAARRDGTA
jgi:hypothetical protein